MTKVMKKLSSVLIAVAMVATMMPAMVFADAEPQPTDKVFSVYVNGVDTGKLATRADVYDTSKEDFIEAQVFPYLATKGQDWELRVVQGRSLEGLLKNILTVNSLDGFKNSNINWSGNTNKYRLNLAKIKDYNEGFKLINSSDNNKVVDEVLDKKNDPSYTKYKTDDVSIHAVYDKNIGHLTPVFGIKYKTFTVKQLNDAKNFNNWSAEGVVANQRVFVGGNFDANSLVWAKKYNFSNMDSDFYNGKFSINISGADAYMDIEMPVADVTVDAMTFNSKDSQKAALASRKLSDDELTLLAETVTWTTDKANVATVDENGNVTPTGVGTCTLTATAGDMTASATVKVADSVFTVKAPAQVKGLKVKNVKTKSANVTWTKVANATAYNVYRSTKKNKGYKLVATTKTTSFKNTKLKKKKTYYFKVAAVTTAYNKSVVGKASAVKKVKIKK